MDLDSGYNVVFATDENYAKYTSVLITSIIYSLKDTFLEDKKEYLKDYKLTDSGFEKNAPFFFHILTNGLSKETEDKFKLLEKELSKVYKCFITIHTISDKIFKEKEVQKFYGGEYLTYFRFYIPLVLKEVKKMVYFDVDMVAMDDVRILWYIDTEGYDISAVKDWYGKSSETIPPRKILPKKGKTQSPITLCGDYFNAGVLIIENETFKKIISLSFDFLDNYKTKFHDQDTLNVVIPKEKVLFLPRAFNFNRHSLLDNTHAKVKDGLLLGIDAKEILEAVENVTIVHSCGFFQKFWKNLNSKNPANVRWREMAAKTPFKDGIFLKMKDKNESIYPKLF